MNAANLYDALLDAQKCEANYLLTFQDGDTYHLRHIDFCYSRDQNGEREFEPLYVDSDDCTAESNCRRMALRQGFLATSGVRWTTVDHIPVGCSYCVDDIKTVFDEARQYIVHAAPTD